MSGPLAFLLVALGGGIGAAARFWLAGAVPVRRPPSLPWGTITVNVVGSFVIGVVSGLVLTVGAGAGAGAGDGAGAEAWRLFLATGICGGFTTFSTATAESVALARRGHVARALVNTLGTLLTTVLAAAAGAGLVLLLAGGS